MEFPGNSLINTPMVDLRYEIEIRASPQEIWPWIQQVGYHRGGWYIDTWWDKFAQQHFWPRVVPEDARGQYKPPADRILPEHQNIQVGDVIPDGPPETAYYEVVALEPDRLLLLYATTHFNYVAPRFVYRTRFAPRGAFCWAFMIEEIDESDSSLVSWWQAEAWPGAWFSLLKPFLILVDRAHQTQILQGIKRRVEVGSR